MLRSQKERFVQSLLYEIGGLILFVPVYNYMTNSNTSESLIVLIALTIACVLWTGIYNYLFDVVEWHFYKKVASDRTIYWRGFHAIMLEASSVVVCVPLLILMADMSLAEALLTDILLTVLFSIYTLVFYLAYDSFRPVDIQPLHGNLR